MAQRRPIQIPVQPGSLPDDFQLTSVSTYQCQLNWRETDMRERVIALLLAMFLQLGDGKSYKKSLQCSLLPYPGERGSRICSHVPHDTLPTNPMRWAKHQSLMVAPLPRYDDKIIYPCMPTLVEGIFVWALLVWWVQCCVISSIAGVKFAHIYMKCQKPMGVCIGRHKVVWHLGALTDFSLTFTLQGGLSLT